MSTFFPYQLTCPPCGQSFEVELLQGIHISRLPHVKQDILDGKFQHFGCPSCGAVTAVESPVIYTDFESGHYVAVESKSEMNWQAARLRHISVYNDSLVYAPPIAQEMGRKMKKRLVFGVPALREKLLLWDAGLDDRIVEACKGDVAKREGWDPSIVVLRLAELLPGKHLLLACIERRSAPPLGANEHRVVPPAAPFDFQTVTHAAFLQRKKDLRRVEMDYPWLEDEWLVDMHSGSAALYK